MHDTQAGMAGKISRVKLDSKGNEMPALQIYKQEKHRHAHQNTLYLHL